MKTLSTKARLTNSKGFTETNKAHILECNGTIVIRNTGHDMDDLNNTAHCKEDLKIVGNKITSSDGWSISL